MPEERRNLNFGTLAGWGALLAGIAAFLNIFVSLIINNNQNNDKTLHEKPTPTATDRLTEDKSDSIEKSSLPDLDSSAHSKEATLGEKGNESNFKDVIDLTKIVDVYHREPLAIETAYLGKILKVNITVKSENIGTCSRIYKKSEINEGTKLSYDDNAVPCIRTGFPFEKSFRYKEAGFTCRFPNSDFGYINKLNAELALSDNPDESRNIDVSGKIIAVYAWGIKKFGEEESVDKNYYKVSGQIPRASPQVMFTECKIL